MKMYCSVGCLIGIAAFIVPVIKSQNVESNIQEYFESEIVNRFRVLWKKHQKPFENAIVMEMQDNYGRKGMNLYITRTKEALQLAKGYYHTDNQVQLVLEDIKLQKIPVLWFPFVDLKLADNIIQFKSSLSKMIIESNYLVFRNKSNIIYDLNEQDPYKNSPFRFQVKNSGELAITIEGCILSANIISKMNAQSVNLGHGSFKLNGCRYTLEISSSGMGVSPVIAKYNFKGEGLNIENLLIKPLKNEFLPKLQAALFTIINTSAIFGKDLSRIRHKQENIFRIAQMHLNVAVRKLNKLTMDRKLNIAELEDFRIKWNDGLSDKEQDRYIQFTKMVMSGLDTAYTAHVGGPYKVNSLGLMEEMRFNNIQVRGNLIYEESKKSDDLFAIDITDVAVNIKFNLTTDDFEFEVIEWRDFEVVASGLTFSASEALISGYLLKVVRKQILKHLSSLFTEAMKTTDLGNNQSLYNAEKEHKLSNNIPGTSDVEVSKNGWSSKSIQLGTDDDISNRGDDVDSSKILNKELAWSIEESDSYSERLLGD